MKRILLSITLLCVITSAYPMGRKGGNVQKTNPYAMLSNLDEEEDTVTDKGKESVVCTTAPSFVASAVAWSSHKTKLPIQKPISTITWVPGKSSSGILPFQRTRNGFEILLAIGRRFEQQSDGTWSISTKIGNWCTLTGGSKNSESSEQTALREGVEEMSFPYDQGKEMIEACKELSKLNAAYKSKSYEILYDALHKTNIPPHKSPAGKTNKNKEFGSSFLYPVDVTDFADDLIKGHKKNDYTFRKADDEDNFYTWYETDSMHWVDSEEIKKIEDHPKLLGRYFRPHIYLSVLDATKKIEQAQPIASASGGGGHCLRECR